jgi:acetyl esterase
MDWQWPAGVAGVNTPNQSKPFIRPDVSAFVEMIAGTPGTSFREMGPVAGREAMVAMGAAFEKPARDIAVVRDLAMPGSGGRIDLRLFDARASRAAGPVLVYFHGGGFVIGDIACYNSVCAELAYRLDLPVVSVEYRLAPESPWPAAPDDCEAAARWIASSPTLLGLDVTGIVPIGDSAGGNLAIVTTMALRDDPAAAPVLAQCPLYPVTDLASTGESKEDFATGYLLESADLDWFGEQYAADRGHWRASPLHGDQAGMPPTVIVTSGLDPLRDEGRAYAAAAANAGVPTIFFEAAGMIHGFVNCRKALPSANDDLDDVIAALKVALALGTSIRHREQEPKEKKQ